ncbi:hypothetical protein BDZ88DRAFT_429756 [Geranomyces variabilis]|nr:hypothetical protein BDZ88DRAFT_429756 [Geranomyces variabilis]KAJ3132197.1 hypothetical protein HDU90_007503 [Geranomyces variabilis]
MSQLNITACVINSVVQQFILTSPQVVASQKAAMATAQAAVIKAANDAAAAYGGPGVLVGVCWPIVVTALVISSWRLKTKPSWRSTLLFIGVLLNVGDVVNLTVAKMTSPFEINPDYSTSLYSYLYTDLLVIFSQARMGLIFWSCSWRFGAVYASPQIRKMLNIGMGLYGMAIAAASIATGLHDLATTRRASKAYWALASIPIPVLYVIIGVGVFTRTLSKSRREIKSSSGDGLKHLEVSNNILMGLSGATTIVLLIIGQSLDTQTNPYVVPTAFFLATFWTFLENTFELLTIFQKVTSATNTEKKNSQHQASASGVNASKGGLLLKTANLKEGSAPGGSIANRSGARLPNHIA